MRILLVSQMYPGPHDPDLGVFVRGLEEALVARGHVVERAVLDRRRRGKRKYLELTRDTYTSARRFRPDVVYAHFLVPSGLIAALAGRAPLVVTAHGRDARNIGELPGSPAGTPPALRRGAAGRRGSSASRGTSVSSSRPRSAPRQARRRSCRAASTSSSSRSRRPPTG